MARSLRVYRIGLFVTEEYCTPGLANGVTLPMVDWLGGVLLPKILQWAQESGDGGREQLKQALVPLDRYSCLYQQMRERYGSTLIKVFNRVTSAVGEGNSYPAVGGRGTVE